MFIRKALPWMVSLLFHCTLFLVPVSLWNYRQSRPAGRFIDLTLEQGGIQRSTSKAIIPKNQAPAVHAAPKESGKAPDAGSAAVPPAKSAESLEGQPREVQSSQMEDALPDRNDAAAAQEIQAGAQAGSPGGMSETIGWQGSARGIVLRQVFQFPKVLSATGQEADCVARITVTSLGTVQKVEIIQSSGYTEIDTRVETALRGYLFSREYGPDKKNTIGIVRFRFRLEKLD